MAFIEEADYTVLIRDEIKNILLEDYTPAKMKRAEDMAISQIKQYISGRYDAGIIFSATGADRNDYIIMIAIDCALYHLYTSIAPNKMPAHRSERYQDAMEWLKMIASGDASSADLPPITDEDGEVKPSVRISSKYKPQNNKW
ncbi:MAG: DUF1320 family protein [Flavobacteriaceae bacterium]|jgi:phage gp36-like protein|nr:DUF1320 family protein [Flavobacteriaceae bacterium]